MARCFARGGNPNLKPKVLLRGGALIAALAFALPLVSRAAGQDTAPAAATRPFLLFPVDVPDSSVPGAAEVTGLLTDVARSRLLASGTYFVTQFHRAHPTIARLHSDQQLTDSDVTKPFAEDNAKGTKIAKLAAYDVIFVGSVDDYQYNATDKQATVTMSGRLLNVADGKIIKSATLSATSAKGGTAKEPERAEEAGRSAAEKLMTQLVPVIAPPPADPAKKDKKRGKGK